MIRALLLDSDREIWPNRDVLMHQRQLFLRLAQIAAFFPINRWLKDLHLEIFDINLFSNILVAFSNMHETKIQIIVSK